MWWLVALGVFLLIAAVMCVPDWIRWAKWNARRKRLPERKANKLRPPVAAPFWSAYAGPAYFDGGGSGGEAAVAGIDGTAGTVGGGGDSDGGGCD